MLNALKLDVCSKMLQITITFAFSSRYAKTRTSKFHKVVRQHTEGMVGVLHGFCGNLLLFPAVKEF